MYIVYKSGVMEHFVEPLVLGSLRLEGDALLQWLIEHKKLKESIYSVIAGGNEPLDLDSLSRKPEQQKIGVSEAALQRLQEIWNVDSQQKVTQKFQNALGKMLLLTDQLTRSQQPLAGGDELVFDFVKLKISQHQAVLEEAARLKSLSILPDDLQSGFDAIISQE